LGFIMGEARATKDPLLGRSIGGKYEIVSFVGRGGMGAVYKAKQTHLKRPVAVKVLHPHHSKDGTYAGRFRREATSASRLDHPNLMRVLDFGQEPDGLLYLVMEYLDGRDLLKILREEGGWLSFERIVDILSQTLAALAVAHEEGIVHRDLKPENIVIVRGKDDDGTKIDLVKVCDFGIAKAVDVPEEHEDGQTFSATITATGALVGTPEYMSPEQAKGERLDARSDLYAIGIILYLLLTGRLPFQSTNSMKVVLKHVTEEPVPPSKYRKDCDPRLEAVCLKALRKMPDDRYATAREMRIALRSAFGLRDSTAAVSARFSLPPSALANAPMIINPHDSAPRDGSTQVDPGLFDKDAPTLVERASSEDRRSEQMRQAAANLGDDDQEDPAASGPTAVSGSVPAPRSAPPRASSSRPPSRSDSAVRAFRAPPETKTGDREPMPETRLIRRGTSPTVMALIGVIAMLALAIVWLLVRKPH
jgi:serine/threonine protein kinase